MTRSFRDWLRMSCLVILQLLLWPLLWPFRAVDGIGWWLETSCGRFMPISSKAKTISRSVMWNNLWSFYPKLSSFRFLHVDDFNTAAIQLWDFHCKACPQQREISLTGLFYLIGLKNMSQILYHPTRTIKKLKTTSHSMLKTRHHLEAISFWGRPEKSIETTQQDAVHLTRFWFSSSIRSWLPVHKGEVRSTTQLVPGGFSCNHFRRYKTYFHIWWKIIVKSSQHFGQKIMGHKSPIFEHLPRCAPLLRAATWAKAIAQQVLLKTFRSKLLKLSMALKPVVVHCGPNIFLKVLDRNLKSTEH